MLRRLTLGFAVLTTAVAIAACSSSDATQTISVGPNPPPQTLYAANVTQNAINIYAPSPKPTNGPQYQIAGGNTGLAGPQYLAFDSQDNLDVTNWLSSTNTGLILQFKETATGNVLPFQDFSLGAVRPRGLADTRYTFPGTSSPVDILAVGVTDPSQPAQYNSEIYFFETQTLTTPYQIIAGSLTGLNVPSGVAFDSKENLYVSNLQGASVEVFALPSPTPSPTGSPTASPTASPTPTATPVGATPTPSTTATPYDLAPIAVIQGGATDIGEPTGLALDNAGNIYVSDQASKACTPACPAILRFPAGSNGAVAPTVIAGSNTLLSAPTDVKIDTSGDIFVADTANGSGVIYEYAPNASGNVAPVITMKSPGSIVGLGLSGTIQGTP
jgi:hypothetical protein